MKHRSAEWNRLEVVAGAVGVAVLFSLSGIRPVHADPSSDAAPPVTQEQFREWTDWAKKSVRILDDREKRLEEKQQSLQQQAPSAGGSGGGGEVNLENLGAPPAGTSQAAAGAPSAGGGGLPKMETYFDLNLVNQPGATDGNIAFDNYHSFVFFDLTPTPDLTFSFNLLGPSTYPVYYELDYRASSAVTLRAGKIWIPFDDLSSLDPHNIFGGRDGLAQLMPSFGGSALLFLPPVWTELGVGVRWMVLDTEALQLQTDMTVTSGFTSGGTDPAGGSEFPNFGAATGVQGPTSMLQGNNYVTGGHNNKAVALRAHALIGGTLGVGLSYYTSQWNPDSDGFGHLFMNIIGADAQLQLGGGFELRAGIASENVMTPDTGMVNALGDAIPGTAGRGGSYGELGIPLSSKWKLLARGGTLQFDSRVSGFTSDVVGGTILYNPGAVQFSLEHSHTLTEAATDFSSYTDLRMIVLF